MQHPFLRHSRLETQTDCQRTKLFSAKKIWENNLDIYCVPPWAECSKTFLQEGDSKKATKDKTDSPAICISRKVAFLAYLMQWAIKEQNNIYTKMKKTILILDLLNAVDLVPLPGSVDSVQISPLVKGDFSSAFCPCCWQGYTSFDLLPPQPKQKVLSVTDMNSWQTHKKESKDFERSL